MASSVGTEIDEIDTASDGFQFDLATAQSITTQGGRKQRNMPFDYVENVRASLHHLLPPMPMKKSMA